MRISTEKMHYRQRSNEDYNQIIWQLKLTAIVLPVTTIFACFLYNVLPVSQEIFWMWRYIIRLHSLPFYPDIDLSNILNWLLTTRKRIGLYRGGRSLGCMPVINSM